MKRRNEVLVGILVTVAVIVGILGTLWLARGGLSSGYPLYTRLGWGSGLKQGQPVLLAGVNIGYVDKVDLRPNGTLVVTMRINEDYHVPEGSAAQVQPVGIFGDQSIALLPPRPSTTYYDPGDTIPAAPPQPSIAQIIAHVDTISGQLSDVTSAIQLQLVRGGGISDLRQTLAATNRLVSNLAAIADEQSRQLTLTMQSLRRTANAVDSARVDSTVRQLQLASTNLAALTGQLRSTSGQLDTVLVKLNGGVGTAGKFLNDTSLYVNMNALVKRLDSLTADFKKNPRRYIKFSVF